MKRTAFVVASVAGLALALALGTHAASARVIMTPLVPRRCPGGSTWAAVASCLAKVGHVTIARELPGAKLVQLGQLGDDSEMGLYLYVEHKDHKWAIGGMFEPGEASELVDFQRVTYDKYTGYRFEVGITRHEDVSLDGLTSVPAVLLMRHVTLCSGDGYRCATLTPSCDLLVRGRARASFHGKLSYRAGQIHIDGDRSLASEHCAQPEVVFLGWPTASEIDF